MVAALYGPTVGPTLEEVPFWARVESSGVLERTLTGTSELTVKFSGIL